jgi:hypothetical protein
MPLVNSVVLPSQSLSTPWLAQVSVPAALALQAKLPPEQARVPLAQVPEAAAVQASLACTPLVNSVLSPSQSSSTPVLEQVSVPAALALQTKPPPEQARVPLAQVPEAAAVQASFACTPLVNSLGSPSQSLSVPVFEQVSVPTELVQIPLAGQVSVVQALPSLQVLVVSIGWVQVPPEAHTSSVHWLESVVQEAPEDLLEKPLLLAVELHS